MKKILISFILIVSSTVVWGAKKAPDLLPVERPDEHTFDYQHRYDRGYSGNDYSRRENFLSGFNYVEQRIL